MKTIFKDEGVVICLNKQETEELNDTGYVLCEDDSGNRIIVSLIDNEYEVWTTTRDYLGIRLNCEEESNE